MSEKENLTNAFASRVSRENRAPQSAKVREDTIFHRLLKTVKPHTVAWSIYLKLYIPNLNSYNYLIWLRAHIKLNIPNLNSYNDLIWLRSHTKLNIPIKYCNRLVLAQLLSFLIGRLKFPRSIEECSTHDNQSETALC